MAEEWYEVFLSEVQEDGEIDTKTIASFDTFDKAWSFRLNQIMDCNVGDDRIHIDKWARDKMGSLNPIEEFI